MSEGRLYAIGAAAGLAGVLLMRRFTGTVFPIERPRITLHFGAVLAPWYGSSNPHKGVDLAPFPGSTGRPVFAPTAGVVAGVDWTAGGGNVLVVEHEAPWEFSAQEYRAGVATVPRGTRLRWRLAHMERIDVDPGEKLWAGQKVGTIGNTGSLSSGPHLHLELHAQLENGAGWRLLDPMHYFLAGIVGLRERIEVAA